MLNFPIVAGDSIRKHAIRMRDLQPNLGGIDEVCGMILINGFNAMEERLLYLDPERVFKDLEAPPITEGLYSTIIAQVNKSFEVRFRSHLKEYSRKDPAKILSSLMYFGVRVMDQKRILDDEEQKFLLRYIKNHVLTEEQLDTIPSGFWHTIRNLKLDQY